MVRRPEVARNTLARRASEGHNERRNHHSQQWIRKWSCPSLARRASVAFGHFLSICTGWTNIYREFGLMPLKLKHYCLGDAISSTSNCPWQECPFCTHFAGFVIFYRLLKKTRFSMPNRIAEYNGNYYRPGRGRQGPVFSTT